MANTISQSGNPESLGARVTEMSLDTFGAIKDVDNGSTTLHAIYAHVSAGSDFLLLWNALNPVPGTDAPDFQFPIGQNTVIVIPGGIPFNVALSACAANVGGTASSGNPTNPMTVNLYTVPDIAASA